MAGDLAPRPWRVGTRVPKNLYDANDIDLGRMDTPELASLVVSEMNVTAHAKLVVTTAIWPLQAFQQILHDGAAAAMGKLEGPLTRAVDGWFDRLPLLVTFDAKPRAPELLLADIAQIAYTEAGDPTAALERIRDLLRCTSGHGTDHQPPPEHRPAGNDHDEPQEPSSSTGV